MKYIKKNVLELTECANHIKIQPPTRIMICPQWINFNLTCMRTSIRIKESRRNTPNRFQATNRVYKANNC